MTLFGGCVCEEHAGRFVADARRLRDPTGTADIRMRLMREVERRYRKLRSLVLQAIADQDMLGIGTVTTGSISTLSAGRGGERRTVGSGQDGRKLHAFQNWFHIAQREVVAGDDDGESWVGPPLREAYLRAWHRIEHTLGLKLTIDPDRADTVVALAIIELDGIFEAVDQQASRELAHGLLAGHRPGMVARAVVGRVDAVGIVRGRAMAQSMVVRAHAEASLDALQLAGHSHVGVVAETVPRRAPPVVTDASRSAGDDREELVEILTAGDDDVCEDCEDIESGGPYEIDEARGMFPAHPFCRCAFVPVDDARYAHDPVEE